MQELGDWQDASAIVLSCPGPLRRHQAAVQPAARLDLPQMLLGSESQLLAFRTLAAAGQGIFFAPFPEMFPGAAALAAAVGQAGGDATGGVVHLRFGGVRSARVLKGARNAAVLAECEGAALLTASHHPFASGRVLPAAMQRAYSLCQAAVRPEAIGGGAVPMLPLSGVPIHAQLRTPASPGGNTRLELVCLAEFHSVAWATGRPARPDAWPAAAGAAVLLPWNMDHPGSIVPELLARFASLRSGAGRIPRIVLLPFNYIGQTGIIRDLIARIRAASDPPGALLAQCYIARVRNRSGLAALCRLSRTAWVDGNDPEHWWTLGRLAACGIATILLDAGAPGPGSATLRVLAEETLRVRAETRCGALIFQSRIPAMRTLPDLLRLTAEQQAGAAPEPAAGRRRAAAIPAGPAA